MVRSYILLADDNLVQGTLGMSRARKFLSVLTMCMFTLLANLASAYSAEKLELGWVEKAHLLPENLVLDAVLDTGANSTSIDATNISRFERDGRPWIRFSVSDRKGITATFERPVVRAVRIKKSDIDATTRPVVMLAICLAGRFREEAVNLTNRSKLRYPLLIGRAAMAGRFLVNPSRKFTSSPDCTDR
jgi:hypothetical protein